jgi:hypothetical protein
MHENFDLILTLTGSLGAFPTCVGVNRSRLTVDCPQKLVQPS